MRRTIKPGNLVVARTAFGNEVEKRALSAVNISGRFPVILVCSTTEWDTALAEGREPIPTAWPADDVWLEELSGAH
jgi:hypothetical protein